MKIEKNIPIPKVAHHDSAWRLIVAEMEIGDSIYFEDKNDAHSLCNSIKRYEPACRGTMRREKKGYRVWKIKK